MAMRVGSRAPSAARLPRTPSTSSTVYPESLMSNVLSPAFVMKFTTSLSAAEGGSTASAALLGGAGPAMPSSSASHAALPAEPRKPGNCPFPAWWWCDLPLPPPLPAALAPPPLIPPPP
eukprot:358869-Chlamydomonas_euryale.AAC.1